MLILPVNTGSFAHWVNINVKLAWQLGVRAVSLPGGSNSIGSLGSRGEYCYFCLDKEIKLFPKVQ